MTLRLLLILEHPLATTTTIFRHRRTRGPLSTIYLRHPGKNEALVEGARGGGDTFRRVPVWMEGGRCVFGVVFVPRTAVSRSPLYLPVCLPLPLPIPRICLLPPCIHSFCIVFTVVRTTRYRQTASATLPRIICRVPCFGGKNAATPILSNFSANRSCSSKEVATLKCRRP